MSFLLSKRREPTPRPRLRRRQYRGHSWLVTAEGELWAAGCPHFAERIGRPLGTGAFEVRGMPEEEVRDRMREEIDRDLGPR